jgi:four helix bundle protein
MQDFRDLQVWQRTHELTLACYRSTRQFPREEINGLTRQMRRCSASIAANIAEGCGRYGNAELHRFLQIAMGSTSELLLSLLLSRDLGYLSATDYEEFNSQVTALKRMLVALAKRVDSTRHSTDNA